MIGDRIRERRKELNMTQQELSHKLSLTRQCISHWENEVNEPSINDLIRLARTLDTTTDFLLGLTDMKSRNIYDKDLQRFIDGCIKLYNESIKKTRN